MYGMNRILKEIGWAAVAVDGFIPPAAFMEFQAYNVLVIAADIRPIDQVLYTPAPDIIHEAAGHAPIIADEQYSGYLRDFGKAGTKAFSSIYDNRMYEAIRHLSILKADPYTSFVDIENAEKELDDLSKIQEMPSEMALLRNLHWWTVEYGLIGTPENPKIYGAGLLSSIGESFNCLKPKVKKLPYTLDARNYSFDITTQQPQLFVTPDFEHLNVVLNEYMDTLSVRKGGIGSLRKALLSGSTCTVVYNSGLQVSGQLVKVYEDDNNPVYLSFKGPAMLSFGNRLIAGHGIHYHKDGYGSPVGLLKGIYGDISTMSTGDLEACGIIMGKELTLEYSSGLKVTGMLKKVVTQKGRNLIFSFENCTVRYKSEELFKPEWGIYDMAVGYEIVSSFAGPANPDDFELTYPAPLEKTHHIEHTDSNIKLYSLYNTVRTAREKGGDFEALTKIWATIKNNYPGEWLLPLEMAEEFSKNENNKIIFNEIATILEARASESEEMHKLISDGLKMIKGS